MFAMLNQLWATISLFLNALATVARTTDHLATIGENMALTGLDKSMIERESQRTTLMREHNVTNEQLAALAAPAKTTKTK